MLSGYTVFGRIGPAVQFTLTGLFEGRNSLPVR